MAIASLLSVFLILVFLVAPIIIGIILIVKSRAGSPFPSCGSCGYDVTGAARVDGEDEVMGLRCPECGADLRTVGITPPQARRGGRFAAGVALICVSVTCAGGGVMLTSVSMVRAQNARVQAVQAQQQVIAAQSAAAAANALDTAAVDEARDPGIESDEEAPADSGE